ncbi:MAG: glycosyltransferase family 4 protein [Sphingobium sp.]
MKRIAASQNEPAIILLGAPQGAAGGGMGRVVDYIVQATTSSNGAMESVPLITRDDKSSKVSSLLLLARAVRKTFAMRRRATLIHINMGDRGSALRKSILVLAGRAVGLPVFLHLHAVEMELLPKWALTALGFVFRQATCVIVLGDRYRQWVMTQFGVKPDRVEILWNGVPVPSPESRAHANTDQPVQILFLGSLGHRKGTHDILSALTLIPQGTPGWRMVFAGPGDLDKYKADAAAAGIAQYCTFTGWLDQAETRRTVSSSDMIVLPSYHEGLPLVILEALGLGTPVIATPVGVIPEVLTDGKDIVFCPVGQPAELAKAMERLIEDPALRQSLCDNGLARYRERFSLQAFSADLVSIWQRYTAKAGRAWPRLG